MGEAIREDKCVYIDTVCFNVGSFSLIMKCMCLGLTSATVLQLLLSVTVALAASLL